MDIHSWCRTQEAAVCAPPPIAQQRFPEIVERVYPRLVRAGHEIPLSVVTDLSCLYFEGPDLGLYPPSKPSVPKELLQPYCRRLNEAMAGGPWRRMLTRTRRALAGERDDMALATFLERAFGLFQAEPGVSLPPQARDAWRRPVRWKGSNDNWTMDRDAQKHLKSFFEPLAKSDPPSPSPVGELLSVAAARVPAGAEGLDLVLLADCLAYELPDLAHEQHTCYQRLRLTLGPVRQASPRSPEYGNHGITHKGKLSAVLRSYLAREDFPQRWVRGDLLYYQRQAPEVAPHRVLLAWVIDRGPAMRTRVAESDLRRDGVALRLAAYTLEDAVRHFYHFPALEIEVVVLLHNGEPGSDLKGLCMQPPPVLLGQAPSVDEEHRVWLPKADGFLPYWFLREPLWPGRKNASGTHDPFAATSTDGAPWQRALTALARLAGQDGTRTFDLCHLALFTADDPGADALGSPLARVAARSGVGLFRLAEGDIHYTAGAARNTRKTPYGCRGVETELRSAYWDELNRQLSSLG